MSAFIFIVVGLGGFLTGWVIGGLLLVWLDQK